MQEACPTQLHLSSETSPEDSHSQLILSWWWLSVVVQRDLVYHEMMAVKTWTASMPESTIARPRHGTITHHHSHQRIEKMGTSMKRWSTLKTEGRHFIQSVIQCYITLSWKSWWRRRSENVVQNAHKNGKKKYEAFYNERIINKTLKLGETIHRTNFKRNKPQKTTKKVIKRNEYDWKSIEIVPR